LTTTEIFVLDGARTLAFAGRWMTSMDWLLAGCAAQNYFGKSPHGGAGGKAPMVAARGARLRAGGEVRRRRWPRMSPITTAFRGIIQNNCLDAIAAAASGRSVWRPTMI